MNENRNVDQPTVESDLWCINDIRTSKTTFLWKIKGFEANLSTYNLEGIKSHEIFIRGRECGDRDSRWMLEIKPGTIEVENAKIEIVLHSMNLGTFRPQLYLQFVDTSNQRREASGSIWMSHTFVGESNTVLESDFTWNYVTFLRHKFLKDGDLEIALEFTFAHSSVTPGSKNCGKGILTSHEFKQELSKNFEEFFLSKEMSDIQIKCGDKTFDAHQFLLSTWSPVFRGMFQAEMKEKESKMVEIQDLDSTVVLDLLKFMYTGRCCINEANPVPKAVSDLLQAADKYQVVVLKKMCEEVMIKILEPNNSLEILEYADMYGAQELKKRALDLVVGNMKTIRGSDEWKEAMKKPHLCVEISEALADRM